MYNIFQSSYDVVLKNWYNLRLALEDKDRSIQSIEVDKWWQQTPLVNHYLHTDTIATWPNPWELLHENHFCIKARGLGMFYTMYLLGALDIEFVEAKDYNSEDVTLVLVENAKYILNYWPNSVVNNNLQDFKIVKRVDTQPIIEKIGLK